MAVIKLTIDNQNTFPHYLALSTDTKPETGIRIGEYLQETDTPRLFQWDGFRWNQVNVTVELSVFEARQLDALERVVQLLGYMSERGYLEPGQRIN